MAENQTFLNKKRKTGQQGAASPEEQQERKQQLKTQGRKGCKAERINLAFTPENHRFIKHMSRLQGATMTEYVNFIIEQYREENSDLYEEAIQVTITLTGRRYYVDNYIA